MQTKRAYKPKPKKVINAARERINELFKQAELSGSKKYANRYVEIARKISMKNKVKMPSELKKRFCKHCKSYLRHGRNVRVRINEKGTIYTCLECKKQMRFPIH
jgi:ribonuclease P protein subunit RPR2